MDCLSIRLLSFSSWVHYKNSLHRIAFALDDGRLQGRYWATVTRNSARPCYKLVALYDHRARCWWRTACGRRCRPIGRCTAAAAAAAAEAAAALSSLKAFAAHQIDASCVGRNASHSRRAERRGTHCRLPDSVPTEVAIYDRRYIHAKPSDRSPI